MPQQPYGVPGYTPPNQLPPPTQGTPRRYTPPGFGPGQLTPPPTQGVSGPIYSPPAQGVGRPSPPPVGTGRPVFPAGQARPTPPQITSPPGLPQAPLLTPAPHRQFSAEEMARKRQARARIASRREARTAQRAGRRRGANAGQQAGAMQLPFPEPPLSQPYGTQPSRDFPPYGGF